jgi:hypothetical protein
MEASWRLQSAVLSRPELISQLIAIAVARFQAGVLRKIDSPAFGWSERLRKGLGGLTGYQAALQNEAWILSAEDAGDRISIEEARAAGRYIESLAQTSVCAWSETDFEAARDAAAAEIESEEVRYVFLEIRSGNFPDGLKRARRAAVDAELTALILDARAERMAVRRPRWPANLRTLQTGVCPEAQWTYEVLRNGTAHFALRTRIAADSTPFHLPLEFTAGTPLKRRPTKKGVVVNPPPPPKPAS